MSKASRLYKDLHKGIKEQYPYLNPNLVEIECTLRIHGFRPFDFDNTDEEKFYQVSPWDGQVPLSEGLLVEPFLTTYEGTELLKLNSHKYYSDSTMQWVEFLSELPPVDSEGKFPWCFAQLTEHNVVTGAIAYGNSNIPTWVIEIQTLAQKQLDGALGEGWTMKDARGYMRENNVAQGPYPGYVDFLYVALGNDLISFDALFDLSKGINGYTNYKQSLNCVRVLKYGYPDLFDFDKLVEMEATSKDLVDYESRLGTLKETVESQHGEIECYFLHQQP